MNSKNNIENLFKDAFEGHMEKPSSSVWKKVDGQMKGLRTPHLFKSAFEQFTVKPSAYVWSKINAALWLPRFLKFNPLSFNVYYAALAVVSTATILTINNNYNNAPLALPPLNYNTSDVSVYRSIVVPIDKNNNIALLDKTSNNQSVTDYYLPVATRKEQDKKEELQLEQNLLSENTDNNDVTEGIVTNNNIDENQSTLDNTSVIEEFNETQEFTSDVVSHNKDPFIEEQIWWMPKLNAASFLLSYMPDPQNYVEIPPGKYNHRNDIVPDTVAFDVSGEPIVIPDSYISIEPFVGTSWGYPKYFASQSENIELTSQYTNGVSQKWSKHYGLCVSAQSGSFSITSGLLYSVFEESLEVETKNQVISEFSYYNLFENEHTLYDTTWALDLDAYLQGDTVYVPLVDSVVFVYTDSVIQFSTDTSSQNITNNYQNSVSYVEIPLIFGYTFGSKSFRVTPGIGAIAGFLSGVKGTYLLSSTGTPVEATLLQPYNKLILSLYGSVKIQYYFDDNFGVMAEPWYRQNLNNIYQDIAGVKKNDYRYGVNIGLTYRF